MRKLLDDKKVAALKSLKAQTDTFDGLVPGLCIRVSKTGRKSWSFHYPSPTTGKSARVSLGTYPALSLKEARDLAVALRAKVEQGIDPRDDDSNPDKTVAELFEDRMRLRTAARTREGAQAAKRQVASQPADFKFHQHKHAGNWRSQAPKAMRTAPSAFPKRPNVSGRIRPGNPQETFAVKSVHSTGATEDMMDHKLATIVGAAAALVAVPAAQQATAFPQQPAVPVASSHADLLTPIPNATERLKIADAEWAARKPMLEQIQYGGPVDHHHHHHHHHHHSHDWYMQNGYRWFGGRWVTGDYYAHHHHHHHHHHHNHDGY